MQIDGDIRMYTNRVDGNALETCVSSYIKENFLSNKIFILVEKLGKIIITPFFNFQD